MKASTPRIVGACACAAIAVLAAGCGIPQEKYDRDMAALRQELDQCRGERQNIAGKLHTKRVQMKAIDDALLWAVSELERTTARQTEVLSKLKSMGWTPSTKKPHPPSNPPAK